MTQPIMIVTSLAPGKNVDNQIKAISSWKKVGFEVVSLNTAEETSVLQPHFPDVEFVQVYRDGRNSFGKPYVYFDDVMVYLQENGSKICGIVNSDIHLLREEFYSLVEKEANNSFVYGSRIDVDTLDNLQGETLNEGFDYFFFDKKLISYYPQSELLLGLPCWDYWAVLIPLFNGIVVKRMISPHAYHIKHKVNWDNTASQVLYKLGLLRYFKPITKVAMSPYYMLGLMYKYSSEIYFDDEDVRVSQYCQPNIKRVINNELEAKIIDDLMFISSP